MSGTNVLTNQFEIRDDTLSFERWQDCEDIIENNKALQNEPQNGAWRQTSSIPLIFIEKWLNEEWGRGNVDLRWDWSNPEFKALVQRKLDDPDFRWLRTDNKLNPFYGYTQRPK